MLNEENSVETMTCYRCQRHHYIHCDVCNVAWREQD